MVDEDVDVEETDRYQSFEPQTFGSSSERGLFECVLKRLRQRESLKSSFRKPFDLLNREFMNGSARHLKSPLPCGLPCIFCRRGIFSPSVIQEQIVTKITQPDVTKAGPQH